MQQDLLLSIIEKQYLGGLTSSVKWKINSNNLTVNFTTILKNCIGELKCPWVYENNELGIYDLSQLYKLVKILKDPLNIEIEKDKDSKKCLRFNMSDENYNLLYNLADLGLISEGKLSNSLPDPLLSLDLPTTFVEKFIKAHNANEKANKLQLKTENKTQSLRFIIGLTEKFANKISFSEPTTNYAELPSFIYDVSNFREILSTNKFSKMSMHVYSMGIVRIDTLENGISVSYYLVPDSK